MSTPVLIAFISFCSVFIGIASTYLITRRTNSGQVDTSDAVVLWKESTAMRDELRNEVVSVRAELRETSTKLADAVARITDLLHQVEMSNTAAIAAKEESLRAKAETMQLRLDVAAVHTEVKTGNALTMGRLADNAESRRIALIPEDRRSSAEREHIDTVGISGGTQREKAEIHDDRTH